MATTHPSHTNPRALSPRERLWIAAGLAIAAALGWAYLAYMGWGMAHMEVGASMLLMPAMKDWGGTDLVLVFVMWTVMMAAMMLPAALPMVQMYARVGRSRQAGNRTWPATLLFVLGYLAVWAGFSAAATLAQWGLLQVRLVSPMMQSASHLLSGLLLVAAGLFQFSGLKQTCLAKCRSPLGFILTEWRDGRSGALVMGLRHGSYCLGCCGPLMALLFVLGVMNLTWILVLALIVLAEKMMPAGDRLSRGAGFVLTGWGIYLLFVPVG